MRQQDFEHRYGPVWQQIEAVVDPASGVELEAVGSGRIAEALPELYSQLCHHLALAKHRRYSGSLINRLNALSMRAHHHLYRHNHRYEHVFLKFLLEAFPAALHRNARFVWIALACFLLPALLMWALCFTQQDMIFSLMDPGQVRGFEAMYEPGNHAIGRERGSETDLMMFGFYIKNNIGISFRTFAGGILFGLGSLFFLIYNGLFIGAAAGHISHVGYQETFFPFVIGHGAFELTAIVFSGAAGLMLGWALIDPGGYTRLVALREAGREAATIILGSALMLLVAAFLEAFWSSHAGVPAPVKYTVGTFFWVLVIAYCTLLGRVRGES